MKNNKDDDEDDIKLEAMSTSGPIPETVSFGSENVPDSQLPSNEYLDLVRQPLFGWAAEDKGNAGLAWRLGVVYVAVFALVSYPIAGATFTQEGYFLQTLTSANFGSISLILALLIRLYTGWGYIGSRLTSNTIEYEETGWFDGTVETKSKAEKMRDLFLYNADVRPVVDRLKAFLIGVTLIWLISCAGLNASLNFNPLFDQYDTAMLERLKADDKLAEVAAQQSGGRPTYCDSRYYRAVAGGAPGCK